MVPLCTASICFVREQHSFFFGFLLFFFLPNSSFRLCLLQSQQPWIPIWHCLLAAGNASWTQDDRQEYFTNSGFIGISKSYMHTCILQQHCTWMTTVQNGLGAKHLSMCSVAFAATQSILLKASNLFWYLPKDKSFFVRTKINGLQCFFVKSSSEVCLKKRFRRYFSCRIFWHLYLLQFVFSF